MKENKIKKFKKQEAKEQTCSDSSGSFETSINPIIKRKIHEYVKDKEMDVDEATDSSVSAGAAYDANALGAKPRTKSKKFDPLSLPKGPDGWKKNSMALHNPKFPKFGGPEGKYIEIFSKCKKFPYCNQGETNFKVIAESIIDAHKKYGIPISEIENILLNKIN